MANDVNDTNKSVDPKQIKEDIEVLKTNAEEQKLIEEENEDSQELMQDSEKAAKSRAWSWIWIIVALLIGLAIWYFMCCTPDESATTTTTTEQTTDSETVGTAQAFIPDANATGDDGTVVEETTVEEVVGEVVPADGTVNNTTYATATQTDNYDIEAEAAKVIHGDYGVEPQRHIALGDHYQAVQHRVNELMRHS